MACAFFQRQAFGIGRAKWWLLSYVVYALALVLPFGAVCAAQNPLTDGRSLAEQIGVPLHVLYVAIQPGYEDLNVLAYYGLGLRARTRVAFITNGEGTEDDRRALYPHQVAAIRRSEAVATLDRFNADAYFLNMPDVVSASDLLVVRAYWNADSLQRRVRSLLKEFMPDLILLAGDRSTRDSLRISIVRSDVLAAVRDAARDSIVPWRVARVAIEDKNRTAIAIAVERRTRAGQPTPRSLADSLGSLYSSMSLQRNVWRQFMTPLFSVLYPDRFVGKSLEAGLPSGLPASIRSLESSIERFKHKLIRTSDVQRRSVPLLRELRQLLDSLDVGIMQHSSPASLARRVLLGWKARLERVRNELLGVSVTFSVADTIVTDRQVIELFVSDVKGLSTSGKTELFVPAVERGWVLNEDVQSRVPLELGKEYRLLSPASLEYNYPQAMYGLTQSSVRKPMYFFVIHRADDRSRSFTWRGDLGLWYAPRFTTEVLTPIVRAMNNETVVLRLTNHSRDGVRDSVYVRDSLVTAPGRMFRLPGKGTTHADTLVLSWSAPVIAGDRLVDVLIDGISTARFLARGFDVYTDLTRRVAVVSWLDDSPAAIALRRIGYQPGIIHPDSAERLTDGLYDVVVVDRQALESDVAQKAVAVFVERGGHSVILPQTTTTLTQIPLFAGLRLESSFRLDERTPVAIDTHQVVVRLPNRLSQEDFDGWLFRRAYHTVSIGDGSAYDVPLRIASGGYPLMVTTAWGKGRATYVDLALAPQWMNVHAGALRLLANLVALR